MSKIYIINDHPGYNKTLPGVIEKWKEQGHQVVADMYYDPKKAEWCDVIFGEYIQGGVIHAFKDEKMTKPIVARGIDIDLYYGHYLGIDWDRAKAILFICDYMKDRTVLDYTGAVKKPKCNIETVYLGIDLTKWTFCDKSQSRGKTIGWINNFWSGKGVGILCQVMYNIIKKDPDFKFEIVGQGSERWLDKYFEEFVKRNGFENNVKRIHYVESVDKWLDNIDYILSSSMKECMSLPIAEAMAKGIKPLIHNWWGADELYPKELVWNGVDEIMDIINAPYESVKYRKYIEDNYTLDKQVNSLNRILGI